MDNIEKSKDHSHSVIAIGLPQVFKFVSRDKIDYLKCDIEGAEYGLLFGVFVSVGPASGLSMLIIDPLSAALPAALLTIKCLL